MTKTVEFIEVDFHNHYLIASDYIPMNIINFYFANNFSNIILPGYL